MMPNPCAIDDMLSFNLTSGLQALSSTYWPFYLTSALSQIILLIPEPAHLQLLCYHYQQSVRPHITSRMFPAAY
jgi:hypothetical protein